MHRFFVSPGIFENHEVIVTEAALLHQWNRVLRFQPGSELILCDGNEYEYRCAITELDNRKSRLEILEKLHKKELMPCDLHLYTSLLHNHIRYEWMLEKCTELGVKSFTPVISHRSQEKFLRKAERLHAIIREACEQSGRTILPQLNEPIKLEPVLRQIPPGESILLGYMGKADPLFSRKISKHPTLHLFIGPEGDFDADELIMFRESNAIPFSLGRQTLRAETAATAAAALLLCR